MMTDRIPGKFWLPPDGCAFMLVPAWLGARSCWRKGTARLLEYLLLLVLLLLSAAFSGAETAFFSLRRNEVAKLAAEKGKAGPHAARLLENSHELLSALLIGNLLVNSAASVTATALILAHVGAMGVAVAVPVITLGLLLFGEITPKMIALRKRLQISRLAQGPLRFWLMLISPVLAAVGGLVKLVLAVFPWERTGSLPLDAKELQTACELAVADGALSETEGRSLARLLELGELEVVHVMTPRTEVVALRRGMSLKQVLAAARRAGFNRYPVLDSEGERLAGLFHLKDLLGGRPDPEHPLDGPLRPLLFVPESKDVAALLAEMRSGRTHLVAVVDEHGDFTGIVTMADCLHALLGPVADSSGGGQDVVALGPGRWIVPGRIDTRDFAEACGVELPLSRDFVTVAGFIMAKLGRVPRPGDEVAHAGTRFRVLEMSDHRIDAVEVVRSEPETDNAGEQEP